MAFNKKEWSAEYRKKYIKTPIGRALSLISAYNTSDKKYNRGKGDLTAQWVVENILSKPCAHCGKTGWNVIGCNRIDNTKPHTMDNVEPCCFHCNCQIAERVKKTVYQYTLDGELVAIYSSVAEAARDLGINQSGIACCCRGGRINKGKWEVVKTYKGYIWSYEPL